MCTKFFSDGDVHMYFNHYSSPYEAYINYMNVLADFKMRLEKTAGEAALKAEVKSKKKVAAKPKKKATVQPKKKATAQPVKADTKTGAGAKKKVAAKPKKKAAVKKSASKLK
jgi:alpha-amylase